MESVTKKLHYLVLVISCSLFLTQIFASELSSGEVDKKAFQLHGIVLFGGTDMFSSAIKIATNSPYSHIGMLLHDAHGVGDESSWYCFESTGSASEVFKGNFPHVRVTPWADTVSEYGGSVTTRLLNFDSGFKPNFEAVTQFVREYNGRHYEKDLEELFLSIVNKNRKSDLDNVFCSELAAEMFMQLGYMARGEDGDGIANNWLPSEFSAAQDADLNLLGVTLGDEVTVKEHRLGRLVRLGLWGRRHLLSC